MKSEDIFEALYCALSYGDYPELFKAYKESEQVKANYDEFISMAGIKDTDKETKLFYIIGDLESDALRHGFQQGLKLGLRLMAAAMNGINP
jgi:hypothetical protein